MDTLFTRSIPNQTLAILAAAARRTELIVTPTWGASRGANDRFAIGTRSTMLRYLDRIDRVVQYSRLATKGRPRTNLQSSDRAHQLHSEHFLAWMISRWKKEHRNFRHKRDESIAFRRVDGNGVLHKSQYKVRNLAEVGCPLHANKICKSDVVARVGVCDEWARRRKVGRSKANNRG